MAASREQEGDLRFPRSGDLRVTKECSEYSGLAGSFCTITASNVDGIGVGSKVIYTRAAGATSIESDIIIDPPGRGSKAFGHVALDFTTGRGLVTLSGGTGKFTHLRASAVVSYLGGPSWAWLGSYRFGSKDD
jgi:hypothetical protein